ncbi:MAG: KH domain-containing protein, partial [Nitrososphaerota archaeon]
MVTAVDKILQKVSKRGELIEFIKNRLRDALIGDISITTTPIGTNIIIYCMKPGLVIGTRGRTIKSLQEEVERRFGLENVQISVSEIEV